MTLAPTLRRPRTVVDVGVLIEGLLDSDSVSARVLRHWLRHRSFELMMSDEILDELERTLADRSVKRRLGSASERLDRLSAAFALLATFVPISRKVRTRVPDDPADEVYLATAAAGQAELLVSNDPHLLALEPRPELQVVSPRAFLDLLQVAAG